jgi:hypothetical protein
MRGIVTGLALLVLAGCGDPGRAELEARLGELVGRSEVELVRRMGAPARVVEAGGRRFLAWSHSWLEPPYVPGAAAAGFAGWGPGGFGMYGFGGPMLVERGCEATFEVAQERVAGFTLRGNACRWLPWPANS